MHHHFIIHITLRKIIEFEIRNSKGTSKPSLSFVLKGEITDVKLGHVKTTWQSFLD